MNCPNCGSSEVTVYPQDDGSAYCECAACNCSFTINP